MCEALKTLMKPEIDAALAKGKAEAAAELSTAINRLIAGESTNKLISDGLPKDIVMIAQSMIDRLK